MNGNGFIKLQRSQRTEDLIRDPNAFALLALIAVRARWSEAENIHGLTFGQALIGRGDHKTVGMSPNKYRGALNRLVRYGYLTAKPTKAGTIATLTGPQIFALRDEREMPTQRKGSNNTAPKKHQPDHQPISVGESRRTTNPTTSQPPSDHQPTTTNEEGKKDKKERRTEREAAASPALPALSFPSGPSSVGRDSDEVLFPWDSPQDVPEQVWRAMRYELMVTIDYLHRAFNDIRGRKLTYGDMRRIRQWPAVLITELKKYAENQKTRPNQSERVPCTDFLGYSDPLGDLQWMREHGYNVKSHGDRLMGPPASIEAERARLGPCGAG